MVVKLKNSGMQSANQLAQRRTFTKKSIFWSRSRSLRFMQAALNWATGGLGLEVDVLRRKLWWWHNVLLLSVAAQKHYRNGCQRFPEKTSWVKEPNRDKANSMADIWHKTKGRKLTQFSLFLPFGLLYSVCIGATSRLHLNRRRRSYKWIGDIYFVITRLKGGKLFVT